jgi:hypothetical protein
VDVVVVEPEHDRVPLERGRGRGEAVRAAALPAAGSRQPHPLEAPLLEPRADGRHQVGFPAAPGPDDGAARGAQLGAVTGHPTHIGVRHVAEHPAHQHQVGRRQVSVLAGQRGVADHDLKPVQARLSRQAAGHRRVARIQLDQPRGHVTAPRVRGQRDDQVAALPGAQADRAQRARRRGVERGTDAVLHPAQPLGQAAARVPVRRVPFVPVACWHVTCRRWPAGRRPLAARRGPSAGTAARPA